MALQSPEMRDLYDLKVFVVRFICSSWADESDFRIVTPILCLRAALSETCRREAGM